MLVASHKPESRKEMQSQIYKLTFTVKYNSMQLFQLRVSRRKGKRSNMSAKGLSGMTSFIPEYITIHKFSTKFKIRSCFFMNINRDHVP